MIIIKILILIFIKILIITIIIIIITTMIKLFNGVHTWFSGAALLAQARERLAGFSPNQTVMSAFQKHFRIWHFPIFAQPSTFAESYFSWL